MGTVITDQQIGHTKAFDVKNTVAVLRTLMHILKYSFRKRLALSHA